MPAFTFEKILPPVHPGPTATTPEKPQGVLNQMIDRLAEKRAKRGARAKRAQPSDNKPTE